MATMLAAALVAYRRLSVEHLPCLERRAVLAGRRQGYSWAAIGRLLGRTRQSVQERFGHAFTAAELAPPRPLVEAELVHRHYQKLRREVSRTAGVDRAAEEGSLAGW